MAESVVYNQDCLIGMKQFPDGHFDLIITDPPYLYLDHKLDRQFDEAAFFKECDRIISKNGFIVLFGRGSSFYKWNTILDGFGYKFLEEVIWNKRRPSSAALPLARVHETISIHTKGNGKIRESLVNYGELKGYDLDKIEEDLTRLGALFNKGPVFERVVKNLQKIHRGENWGNGFTKDRHKITFSSPSVNRCISTYMVNALEFGSREQSIISDADVHYGNIHPTQKPVRLIERLMLILDFKDKKPNLIDPFLGSGSHRIAAYEMNFDFTGFEIDKDYFEAQEKRFKQHIAQQRLFV